MTYGVYDRDMKSVSLNEKRSIEDCKKYLWHDNVVVCSEKRYMGSWGIEILFHKWRGFHYYRCASKIVLGFVSIETHSHYYTWADKIVYDPKKEGGANNG